MFPEMFGGACPIVSFTTACTTKSRGCAVRAAVEQGEVAESRYQNYLEMLQEFEGGPIEMRSTAELAGGAQTREQRKPVTRKCAEL